MLFFYSARNSENELVRGTIDAMSAQAAREALKEMNLLAEELHEATLHEKEVAAKGKNNFPDKLHTPNLVLEGEVHEPKQEPVPIKEEKKKAKKQSRAKRKIKKKYYPFLDTLRLYAGWLLAWYCIVYILGGYQHTRELSFRIPYVEALLPPYSPIVLTFTLAAFLFLLCTSLHRVLKSNKLAGIALTIAGIAVFSLYRINV